VRAWMGLLVFAVWFGGTYLRIRAQRRSGVVQNFGHPILDQFLLLGSGLLLAGFLTLALFLFGRSYAHPLKERFLAYAVLLAAGGLLTWLSNGILRRMRK
jgi:hypothetical protein